VTSWGLLFLLVTVPVQAQLARSIQLDPGDHHYRDSLVRLTESTAILYDDQGHSLEILQLVETQASYQRYLGEHYSLVFYPAQGTGTAALTFPDPPTPSPALSTAEQIRHWQVVSQHAQKAGLTTVDQRAQAILQRLNQP